MTAKSFAAFQARARILKALAHPSRLCVVDALSRGELCVRDLTCLVGADISTVSKHLAVLKSAGLLTSHKRGLQVYYSLTVPCVTRFFDCVTDVLAARASRRGANSSVCHSSVCQRR